jgi:hypothetical protein
LKKFTRYDKLDNDVYVGMKFLSSLSTKWIVSKEQKNGLYTIYDKKENYSISDVGRLAIRKSYEQYGGW